jgi:replicative DNA helicase
MEKEQRLEAERALAGSMLLDGVRLQTVCRTANMRAGWFHVEPVKVVVETVQRLWAENRPVDLLTVVDELRRAKVLEDIGGVAFVEGLVDSTPTAAHAEYYLDLLRQESLRRNFRAMLVKLSAKLDEESPELVVSQASALFDGVLRDHECMVEDRPAEVYDANIHTWEKAKEDRAAGIQPDVGVRLPWWRLTKLIGGLKPGLHILGARPSTGKTTMEGMIRCHAAMNGVKVLAQQIDMSKEGLLMRDQCRMAGVSYKKLAFGYARHDQIQAVKDSTEILKKLPMNFIFAKTSMELLQARARALKARGMLGLITIDCGQLLTCAGSGRMDLAERTERVSGTLKALSLELEVPVLCLLQLRRPVDQKAREQTPDMEDLYGGRFWEANALSVALIYRHEKTWKQMLDNAKDAYEARTSDKKWRDFAPRMRPIVWFQAKNQNGEVGTANFLLNTNYFQFVPANQDFEETRDETPEEGMLEEG